GRASPVGAFADLHIVGREEPVLIPYAKLGPFVSKLIRSSRARRRSNSTNAGLTARECQIMRQVACGRTNREIADSLHIKESTVKKSMTVVMEKLVARNRVEAVLRFLQIVAFILQG